MENIVRSYKKEITDRLIHITRMEEYPIKIIGETGKGEFTYPIYTITANRNNWKRNKKDVILSAGVHGDEIGGVNALLDFLENRARHYMDRFRFHCYPCINPEGFERNTRTNRKEQNLNREFFKETESEETKIIMAHLKKGPEEYLFTMDMHETGPKEGSVGGMEKPKEAGLSYYMWEMCDDPHRRVGHKMIKELEEKGVPICKTDKIFGELNFNGVIWYPEGMINPEYSELTTFDAFLKKHYTKQSFTTETSMAWPIETRSAVQITALETALKEIKG